VEFKGELIETTAAEAMIRLYSIMWNLKKSFSKLQQQR
jgi:hypothetical protein